MSLKDWMMEKDEIGWGGGPDKNVCGECIKDEALQQVVEENAKATQCDYCGRQANDPIAAPLGEVTWHMAECIHREYCDPAEELPWEGREGGYQGPTFDTSELLDEIGFEVDNQDLFDDVAASFDRQEWCDRHWYSIGPIEARESAWEDFKETLKHQRRYTFWSLRDERREQDDCDYIPVGGMLKEVEECIHTADIFTVLPAGTQIWRGRSHSRGETLSRDADFASPPVDRAKQNRMSPAGIPMFYGAEDLPTACLETVDRSAEVISVGMFETARDLVVLNLAALPAVPSFFDLNTLPALRYALIFLRGFARDLSQPIERDGREHIEYVPTQAFTEYVRWHMHAPNDRTVDGIKYRSAKNGSGCYVLFLDHDACLGSPPNLHPTFRFDPAKITTCGLD